MSPKKNQGPRAPRPPARTARRVPNVLLVAAVVAVVLTAVLVVRRPAVVPAAGPRPNVLLITLDTARADRLGAYGYAPARTPNLDALARAGVRFDDATAASPITGPAHAALLTGLYPARLGVRDNVTTPLPADATTLAEVLSGHGYATGGFIGVFLLDRPYGFAQGFETFESGFTRVDSGSEANAERPGNFVVNDAVRWLASLPADRPFFGWVHLYDPHTPYAPPEPLASGFAGRLYDGEMAFVDQQVGRLIETLRARGALDRTLVAVIADHGESLGEHGEDEHGVFLYEAVLRVPWLMSGPGLPAGRAIAEQVRAVDLVPTLLEALALGPLADLDGRSVVGMLQGRASAGQKEAYAETYYPRLHYGWSELRSIRDDGWKAIDAPLPELYNLRDDPHELRNLYEQYRARGDAMIARAAALEQELTAGRAPETNEPDADTMARLRSLGYLGVAAAQPKGVRLPDPKDKVTQRREYNALMSRAIDALSAGNPAAAAATLQELLRKNERASDVHQLLGEVYQRQGRLDEALGEFAAASVLNPEAAGPRLSAAEIHLEMNDLTAARKRLEDAARTDPDSFDVALVTGRVLEREKRPAEAMAAYERAVRLNPANPRARSALAALASDQGRFDIAEAQIRRLLEMNYRPARTYVMLGRVAQMQGRLAEAADHYRTALRLEPGLATARQGLEGLRR